MATRPAVRSAHPPGTVAAVSTPARSRRRRLLERLWILGSVAYGGLRIFIADRTVKRYGVNIWAFAAVELSTSWIYGLSTARVVGALVDRHVRLALKWGVLAAVTFLAPETFIILTGRDMPAIVYVIVLALVSVLGTAAVISLLRRVRAGRRAHEPAPDDVVAPIRP